MDHLNLRWSIVVITFYCLVGSIISCVASFVYYTFSLNQVSLDFNSWVIVTLEIHEHGRSPTKQEAYGIAHLRNRFICFKLNVDLEWKKQSSHF